MDKSNDMTPMQRIAALRISGVTLFSNLSDKEKKAVLYVENEPAVSAQVTELNLAAH